MKKRREAEIADGTRANEPGLIIQYVSVRLKLNSENEAHLKHHHSHGNNECPEIQNHREIQEDRNESSEDD